MLIAQCGSVSTTGLCLTARSRAEAGAVTSFLPLASSLHCIVIRDAAVVRHGSNPAFVAVHGACGSECPDKSYALRRT